MITRPFVPPFLLQQDAFPLCAETDPGAFHPEQGEPSADAQAICGRCELRNPCAQWAIANPDLQGIWGGLTGRDRRDIRSRNRVQRRPARNWTDSDTQAQVIDLTIRGWTPSEIARELGISSRTVCRIRARERDAA